MSSYREGTSHIDKFVQRYKNRFNLAIDDDWSYREKRMHILKMFLDGTIYDELEPFHVEYSGGNSAGGQYIPIANRRPSAIYRIPKIIVDESTAMLFGEEHFPLAYCEHEKTRDFLHYITEDCDLRYAMINAAKMGSIGSVCVMIKVLDAKFHFDVIGTRHLFPVFDSKRPNILLDLIEKRKYDGATLMSLGFKIDSDDKNEMFYLIKQWTPDEEIHYIPYKCDDEEEENFTPTRDNEKSVTHKLGFVPAVWIKNTPRSHHIDGDCTFEAAIDMSIVIDYQLSQLDRGLKYNSDPTLVIKNPTTLNESNQLVKGAGVLNLDEKGEAYLVEMSNDATKAVLEFVRCLREFSLESVRGNRANPDKMSSVHSGKALQMLNSPLVSLVGEMRLAYGEFGLIKIYQMVMEIFFSNKFEIDTDGFEPEKKECHAHIELKWPDWYPPTPQDKMQEQQALVGYINAGVLSLETSREIIQEDFDIYDIEEEAEKVAKDRKEGLDLEIEKAKRTQVEPGNTGSVDRG